MPLTRPAGAAYVRPERTRVATRGPVLDSTRSTARGDDLVSSTSDLAWHELTRELLAAEDAEEVAGIALAAAAALPNVSSASLWVPVDDQFECRGALGDANDHLRGVRIPSATASKPIEGEGGHAVLAAGIAVAGELVALLRVSKSPNADGFTDAEHERLRRLADVASEAMSAARRLGASRAEVMERTRELDVVSAMSREVAATLDLDRVLRSAVNLASRVISFDRCAIALYERGGCDIRAVAGADGVDAKSVELQDLAVRAAWAAGRGEPLYLSDRAEPGSDAERMFVKVFREDLERDRAASALYLPMKDEEGVIGVLLFEAERIDFASEHQRSLAAILANQTTVSIRNAQLYRQVPMADALGALAARQQALLAMPRRRRVLYGAVAIAVIAALTLIRWPLRISGADAVLRPLAADRVDSLAVELSVAQEDVLLVRVGNEVRVRVNALPFETFSGRVTSIAPEATGDAKSVRFPVRAVIVNGGGALKPGMSAYVRVLTTPTSMMGRLLRGPIRIARLLWWRFWS